MCAHTQHTHTDAHTHMHLPLPFVLSPPSMAVGITSPTHVVLLSLQSPGPTLTSTKLSISSSRLMYFQDYRRLYKLVRLIGFFQKHADLDSNLASDTCILKTWSKLCSPP